MINSDNYADIQTAKCLVDALSNQCCANSDKIVDLLTGYLWSESEAKDIKNSANAFDPAALMDMHKKELKSK